MTKLALLVLTPLLAHAQSAADTLARLKATNVAKLADYVAFYSAQSRYEAGEDQDAAEALKPVWQQTPKSPLSGPAALLAAKVYLRAGEAKRAAELLKRHYENLAQPEGDLALGGTLEAAQDPTAAVPYYQRIYSRYPASPAAQEAQSALARLGNPALPKAAALGRAGKLMDSGNNSQARVELQALLPQLSGSEREAALIRIGVTYYNARDNAAALDYFRGLELTGPDAEAERLYYVLQCARRLNNLGEVKRILEQLARQYPKSKWRLEAITATANFYTLSNQTAEYEPLFRACADEFPDSPAAANCHWRIAFTEYMRRNPVAADLLSAHIRRYPKSEKLPAALYFLGRLAEQAKDAAGARAYFQQLDRDYTNYYYAVLARQRLAAFAASTPARPPLDLTPNATAKFRLERAALLSAAGLDELAEKELEYAARHEDQPRVLALALAQTAMKRDAPERSIRYMKRFASGYLFLPVESAPLDFWKLAYPLAYREPLERFAKQEGLDPFLVAALIRQESEFDKNAISRSKAYGLTQMMPSTGRDLARRAGIRLFNANMLFQPEISLQLGTHFLKSMLGQLDNRLEATLAAYNAGKTRAVAWLSWYDYREPAEFVETIPFTETRNYVQIVIRNADLYRRLYAAAPHP